MQRRGTGYIAAGALEEALRSTSEESKKSEPPVIEKKHKSIVT
jgi:hypothetical protein